MKKNKLRFLYNLLFTIVILVISTFIGIGFKELKFHETNIVLIYLFSILIISRFTTGYVYGIVSSIISLLLFNWFFTEPYFTFKVDDVTYFMTFAIMMVTSIVTSALTTKVKKVALDAKEREKESNALYRMTNHLTDAEDEERIGEIIVKTTSDILLCNTAFIIFIVGSLAITLTANCTLVEAMFDFASSLSTVGLSIGITGPMTNDLTLIIEIIGMLLGRLEIFIVIIGFAFGFKQIKNLFFKKRLS